MKITELPEEIRFLFVSMMQSAIYFKRVDYEKEFFLNFAEGVWESMLLSDLDYLEETLNGYMAEQALKIIKDLGD